MTTHSRSATALALLFTLAAATAAACGGRSSLTDDLVNAPLTTADAAPPVYVPEPVPVGGGGADAGPQVVVADAAPDVPDQPDVALPANDLGDIFLLSGEYSSGTIKKFSAKAEFFPSVAATGCVTKEVLGCSVETCAAGDAGAIALASAGDITIGGGNLIVGLASSGPGGAYSSTIDGGATTLWQGGEMLTVAASGGDVPAFMAVLTAPTQLIVTTPWPSSLPRDAATVFTWKGSSAGKVAVDLSATDGTTNTFVECLFDVAAGSGSVPAEAVRHLPPGVSGLTVSSMTRGDVAAGPWQVRAFAQTNGNDPQGREYDGSVTVP